MVTSKNRELVYKVLTDPAFRAKLQKEPAAALGKKELTPVQANEVKKVLDEVDRIQMQVNRIADELLCANGGPCGIAKGGTPLTDRTIKR
jgi:hypothetical protein